MSLEYAAEAVRSKGRGDDTMLVHMTPGEVKGLQQLAMAYGGSLSTNPETGLPEAGFLKSLLPTLIGAGLAATGMGPLAAGLTVGGIETVRSGDLGKGLLAGLGAYGGAGFAGAAAAAAAPTGAVGLTPGAMATGLPTPIAGGAANVAGMAGQPVMTNLSTMGSGVSNIFSSGAAGAPARAAALQQLGGSATSAALRGTAALAGPLLEPAPMPEVAQPEYNYDGPYKPTERKVRYPGPERDPTDSSEFQYFDVVNPSPGFEPIGDTTPSEPIYTYGPDAPRFAGIPVEMATDPERMRDYQQNPDLYSFAKGGVAKPEFTQMPAPAPAAPINTAPQGYVAGRDAEFDYGFQPMANVPSTQPVGRGVSGIEIGPGTGFAATNLTGAQHSQLMIDQFKNHPKFGPQLRAAGYAEGGATTAPPAGYVAGQDAEFNYGFSQMPTDTPVVQDTLRASRAMGAEEPVDVIKVQIASNNSGGGGDDYRAPNPNNTYNFNQGSRGLASTAPSRDFAGEQQSRAAAAAAAAASDPMYDFAKGGEVDMHNNGFVVDAHTVSEVGNGSSNAGMERFARIGGQPIMGPGDGTSDSIPANIDGMQPAMVARDEVYMPPDAVAMYGGGSLKIGEKKLYALMEQARKSRKKNGRGQSTGLKQLVG
jgi:hypothetical protein